MARDPYAFNSLWDTPYPQRTEIDMRQELVNMFNGSFPEMAKAQWHLLRKFRRNANFERIQCDCVDPLTHEPDKDVFCPICHGEGFLWDEVLIQLYKQSVGSGGALREEMRVPGLENVDLYAFYLKSCVPITLQDKIVTVAKDEEGNFAEPLRRDELWRLGLLLDLRSDNGRLEFWKAYGYAEKRTFLNGPTRNRIDR